MSLYHINNSDEHYKETLHIILTKNFQDEHNKQIIGYINKLLSTSKTNLRAFHILNYILDYCTSDVILGNSSVWMAQCLNKSTVDNLKEIKLSAIGKIVEREHDHQDFTKSFLSDYMPKLLDICLTAYSNPNEVKTNLETLIICMKCYSSWFTIHKSKIESFILNFLDSSTKILVEKAAIAFHYLQQLGGAGLEGINYKNNFSSAITKLCSTVHVLYDTLFENETEIEQYTKLNVTPFSFRDSHEDAQKTLLITGQHILNCLIFLKAMLLKGFPVPKEIKPLEILDVVSRGLAFHNCVSKISDKSITHCNYPILLINIQVQLLHLLRVFILWSQTNCLPFAFHISKILTDSLARTQNCNCFKLDSTYQETVYKVLKCWVGISKSSLHTHYQEKLIKCILNDITLQKKQITLNINPEINQKSKKAKRKAVQEHITNYTQNPAKIFQTVAEKKSKENACSYALDLLKHLLVTVPLNLPQQLLKNLYTTTIGTLFEIHSGGTINPYINENSQIKLYEVLVAFYEQPQLVIHPPLQVTLDILGKGVNSKNRHIAMVCEHGLSCLEKLCQPVCPSLDLPDKKTEVDDVMEYNNTIILNGNEIEEIEENVNTSNKALINILDIQIITKTGQSAEDTLQNSETEKDLSPLITENSLIENTTSQENFASDISILRSDILKDSEIDAEDVDVINAEINKPLDDKKEEIDNVGVSEDSANGMIHESSDMKKATFTEEPPMKKIRIQELEESEVIGQEVVNISDDEFVDVVKDY